MKEKTKQCNRCKRFLPLSAFSKNRKSKDGLHYYCKECIHDMYKDRYMYESDKRKEAATKQYYETDYKLKKYLKRYEESLAYAQERKAELEKSKQQNGGVLDKRGKYKEFRNRKAIARWIEKIHDTKQKLEEYNQAKAAQESQPVENTSSSQQTITHKEQPAMTKNFLIQQLESVPDNAQIIYVGDQETKSALVAAWKSDADSVVIRNLTNNMSFVIAEGKLFELVSATMGNSNPTKEE